MLVSFQGPIFQRAKMLGSNPVGGGLSFAWEWCLGVSSFLGLLQNGGSPCGGFPRPSVVRVAKPDWGPLLGFVAGLLFHTSPKTSTAGFDKQRIHSFEPLDNQLESTILCRILTRVLLVASLRRNLQSTIPMPSHPLPSPPLPSPLLPSPPRPSTPLPSPPLPSPPRPAPPLPFSLPRSRSICAWQGTGSSALMPPTSPPASTTASAWTQRLDAGGSQA